MATAFIALGCNLGDRQATLQAAVRRLRAEPGLRVLVTSALYETAPVGGPAGQGPYLNGALALQTDHTPEQLLAQLHQIETRFGRIRTVKDGPRTLDLDLLLYDSVVIQTEPLTVPHPRLADRLFVLVPLAEIAPEVVHPILGRTVQQLLDPLLAKPDGPLPRVHLEPRRSTSELSGQRALVTGSTSGIGAAVAMALQDRGAQVVRHGRRPRLDVQESYLSAHLRDPVQVDRLAQEVWQSGLDILVCNAGADVLTGEAAEWSFERKLDELLAVDLKATIRLARTLGSRMKARGRGVIVTMGWDQAETGMAGDSGEMFAAVKGAVMCYTRSLALSLAPEVQVHCVAPGWIRTAWGDAASATWQERVRSETPLGVWGLPEDVAAAVAWLVSPSANYLTGQTIRVNGGAIRQ